MTIDYSIVIPAYNEEELLPRTLSSLKEAMLSVALSGEIIVTDNNSSDNTAKIAEAHGARVVFEPLNRISRARNAGAEVAAGRYFIFVDADTVVSDKLLQIALDDLESGLCAGGGARVAEDKTLSGMMRSFLVTWNWVSERLKLAAGCFVYARKDGFEAIGGFSEKVYASEELWFSLYLKSWGRRRHLDFRIIDEPPVISSVRKVEWYSDWRLINIILLVLVFPLTVRFKGLCALWYRRPDMVSEK